AAPPRPERLDSSCGSGAYGLRASGHFADFVNEGTSQSRTVPSRLPEASSLPSGEKATELTNRPCPSSERACFQVEVSHTLTTSSLAAASNSPPGLNATTATDP